MSDLILSWLNDEVQLNKKITSFEHDFANGYYFGELLAKFNQQLNFDEFVNKDLVSAKNNNFKLLEPTFKILKVKYNINKVRKIMGEEQGEARKMLYNLKMALDKVNNPADIIIMHKTGKFNPINPLKRLEPARTQFDTMESRFFEKRINELSKAQKQINLDKHLEKFTIFKNLQEEMLNNAKKNEELKDIKIKEEMRKIQLNKLQRNMAFIENWNEKGHENWEKNQQIMKERSIKDEKFDTLTEEKHQIKALIHYEATRKELYEGIFQFEANLLKLGIDSLNENEQKSVVVDHTMFSASATMSRIKERKKISDFLRKERDKRRRKMIVDQAKAQRQVEVLKREELLINKLTQESRQEKELTYEIWRAECCEKIIEMNRELRNKRYGEKREKNVLGSKIMEEQMLKILQNEFAEDQKSKKIRLEELQIQTKKEKRKRNYEICSKITEQILDIADIFFQKQQDIDTDKLDGALWKETIDLFENNKCVIEYKSFRNPLELQNIITKDSENESIDFLCRKELEDYIKGKNQWNIILKNEQPENPELDEKFIPNKPINNYYMGDLMKLLLKKQYENDFPPIQNKRDFLFEKKISNYLPLKLSIIGYDFSGKRTLYSYIKKKYDKLEIISVEELIENALIYYNKIEKEIEQEKIEKEKQKQNTEHEEINNQNIDYTNDELYNIGKSLRKYLSNGEKIPDEVYINLISYQLRTLFPPKNFADFIKDYDALPNFQKNIFQKKLSSLGGNIIEAPLTKDEQFEKDIMYHEHKYAKGWILYDFPQTYEQAKLLETELTGFLTKDEQTNDLDPNEQTTISELDRYFAKDDQGCNKYEKKLKIASLLVSPKETKFIERNLIRGGLDCVIYLKTDKEECLRRALGRRIDSKINTNYHLDNNLPPTDNAPLIERLVNVREIKENELVLIDKLNAFDNEFDELKKWIQIFGINENGKTIQCWNEIDGKGDPIKIFERINGTLEEILYFKEEEFKLLVQQKRDERTIESQEEELKKAIEAEKEISLTNPETIKSDLSKIKGFSKENIMKEHLSIFLKKLLNDLIKLALLFNFWEHIQNYYLSQTFIVFTNMRKQREHVTMRLSEIQRRYLELIQKNDNRQSFVLDYQEKYNKFLDENPDMIEELSTKEEMHQRIDDLHDVLFDLIETKKEEGLEERRLIMTSSYIENEIELYTLNIQNLVQAELFRSFKCLQLLSDYYALLDRKEFQEMPEYYNNAFNFNYETIPFENEENNTFPRLEKIINDALRIYNGEEEEIIPQGGKKQVGKAIPTKKEDPKKKIGKGGKEIEEEKKEETPNEITLKKAINIEKAIFRYRIQIIKTVGINRLTELRNNMNNIYSKLDLWCQYSYKVENEAVCDLTKMLRDFVEKEMKIQKEIQLNYVDVVTSFKVLNFLTPPPIILQAREKRTNDRFTISQLYDIIEELKNIADFNFRIESRTLQLYLSRKNISGVAANEIPESWSLHDFKTYQKLIDNLDEESNGYIDGKTLSIYLCLLNSKIIENTIKLNYEEELKEISHNDNFIRVKEFINVPAWFDETECSEYEENSHPFDREKHIKELIFSLLKDENDTMNINKYLSIIDLTIYKKMHFDGNGSLVYYRDFLFN